MKKKIFFDRINSLPHSFIGLSFRELMSEFCAKKVSVIGALSEKPIFQRVL